VTAIRAAPKSDVITPHVVKGGLFALTPAVSLIARAFGRPFVLRKFGGLDYRLGPALLRGITSSGVRTADIFLVETKEQVDGARSQGIDHARWYPNNRPMPELSEERADAQPVCRRFLYLGRIESGKGVCELLEVAEGLAGDLVVDICGTLGYDIPEERLARCSGVAYRGPPPPEAVPAVLRSYGALVIPTHHAGEGYPGVVTEAYAAGMPVICTRWQALPELVDESTGILVEPWDADDLRRAMIRLHDDPELFRMLRAGVGKRRRDYDSAVWAERFVAYCREVAADVT